MQEDIVQPGYTVGSSFGQASRMINGGLVRDLLFDHQVDVRYFFTDNNGDPAKDANGKRAHKSILFRDDQNRLLCEGTHYPASSIKTAGGLGSKPGRKSSGVLSTKRDAQKIVVLRKQYKNDVTTVVACCAEAIACSRISGPADPLYDKLKDLGSDLVMFGSGGSSMLASEAHADVRRLAAGPQNTGHVLCLSDGQHSLPRPSQLSHDAAEDQDLEEALKGVSGGEKSRQFRRQLCTQHVFGYFYLSNRAEGVTHCPLP